MTPTRLFTAVELPPGLRTELDACAMELLLRPAPGARPKQLRGLSMVPPQNLHITVRFLGDVEEERIPEISDALRTAAASVAAGATRLQGFGAFPTERRPSVVWCGLAETDTLESLAQAAAAALAPLGVPPEQRAYHPHVTVARLREARTRRVIAERLAANLGGPADGSAENDDGRVRPPSATIPVEHLTLFSSNARRPDASEAGRDAASRPKGVHYDVLARHALGSRGTPDESGSEAS